jgi:hypothetical protein
MRHLQRNADFVEELKDVTGSRGALKIVGIWEIDLGGKDQTPTRRAYIEFCGEAQASNGQLIELRRRYEISKDLAEEMLKAFDDFRGREFSRRPPRTMREYMMDVRDGFTVMLRLVPEKRLVGLVNRNDGWEFFTDKVDEFPGMLAQATQ